MRRPGREQTTRGIVVAQRWISSSRLLARGSHTQTVSGQLQHCPMSFRPTSHRPQNEMGSYLGAAAQDGTGGYPPRRHISCRGACKGSVWTACPLRNPYQREAGKQEGISTTPRACSLHRESVGISAAKTRGCLVSLTRAVAGVWHADGRRPFAPCCNGATLCGHTKRANVNRPKSAYHRAILDKTKISSSQRSAKIPRLPPPTL